MKQIQTLSPHNFLSSNLCILTLVLLLYITKKSLVSFPLYPIPVSTCVPLYTPQVVKSTLPLLFPRLNQPRALHVPLHVLYTSMGTLHWTHSCMSGSILCQELKPGLSGQSYQCLTRGQDPSSWWCSPKCTGCLTTWVHCCVLITCWSQVPQVFSGELL